MVEQVCKSTSSMCSTEYHQNLMYDVLFAGHTDPIPSNSYRKCHVKSCCSAIKAFSLIFMPVRLKINLIYRLDTGKIVSSSLIIPLML